MKKCKQIYIHNNFNDFGNISYILLLTEKKIKDFLLSKQVIRQRAKFGGTTEFTQLSPAKCKVLKQKKQFKFDLEISIEKLCQFPLDIPASSKTS